MHRKIRKRPHQKPLNRNNNLRLPLNQQVLLPLQVKIYSNRPSKMHRTHEAVEVACLGKLQSLWAYHSSFRQWFLSISAVQRLQTHPHNKPVKASLTRTLLLNRNVREAPVAFTTMASSTLSLRASPMKTETQSIASRRQSQALLVTCTMSTCNIV